MAKNLRDPEPAKPEGPRSFGVILLGIADGAVEAECSRDLFKMVSTLKSEAKVRNAKVKGTFTLKLDMEVDGEDAVVVIRPDVSIKLPKPLRRNGHMWISAGGNLTSEAPKQSKLPFQEVANERGVPHDLPLHDDDGGDKAREA